MSEGKIGIDVRWMDQSGIGTTVKELLNHLDENQKARLVLFSEPGRKTPEGFQALEAPFKRYGMAQHFSYPSLIRKSGVKLFHMPHFDIPYFCPEPFISTIHDLIHVLFPGFSTKPFARVYAKTLISRITSRSAKILTVSKNTKNDLINYFGAPADKIRVAYPAISGRFCPQKPEEVERVVRRYHLPSGYLLYVGNLRGSKNTAGLLEAYTLVKKRRPDFPELVLAGQNFLDAPFPEGVRYLGAVPFEDLPPLYAGCSLFVFPSFYEGFGLPPLEAMACGAPVLSSNAASLPEVCGDAAFYVNPQSVDELAEGMETLLESTDRRRDLAVKGAENVKRFSWKRFAQETWASYEEVLS